jgi:Kef-type K+ transport system membrane component KefB
MSAGHVEPPTLRDAARSVAALAIATGVYLGLRATGVVTASGPLFALGYLVIAGQAAGSIAALVRLPRLTGYLVAGLLSGPEGFALFSSAEVRSLSLINALALALIALQAGAEMTLPMLARTGRSLAASSLAQIAVVIPAMALAFYLSRDLLPFTAKEPTSVVVALAVLWGVFMLTRSPAVTLAVLSETRAKGPMADFSLGIVVVLDVIVLPLFAVAFALARGEVLQEPFSAAAFSHLANELFASVAAGISLGLLTALLFLFARRERALVVIVLSYAVTAACAYLRYDTLLVFVIGGFLVMNLTKQGKALVETSEDLASAVMIVFFATAGAKLDPRGLVAVWPVALLMFVVRAASTWVSVALGARLARDPPAVRRNAWLSLISQAGVTIGLATIVADALPGVGAPFASLVIAAVSINTIAGAVVFKLGLSRAGEVPKDDVPSEPAHGPSEDQAEPMTSK